MYPELKSISPNAKIGQNVIIGNFTTIEDDVVIGNNTWIGPNVTIFSGARIGNNCKIFPGAVIAAIPQDLKFGGEKTLAVIGDNTTIRECATINRGTKAHGETIIGTDCFIMAYSHVAHDCIIGNNVILSNSTALGGHIEIGDWAILGGACAIHQFCKIGAHSILAGGSLVDKDIPPYVKAARYPISYAGVNTVGLSRRGFSSEKIKNIRDIYRALFQQSSNYSAAIQLVKEQFPDSPEKNAIVAFFEKSERGIMKGYTYIRSRQGFDEKEEED